MKSRPSKLDQFAAQLADLDAEKKTLSEICEWLQAAGCKVSPSSVSVYLERLRSERRQMALLGQIASGARQCADVEKQFGKNPAPELETLIKLQRVLILNLSTQASADPELMKLVAASFGSVMEAERLKLKRGELELSSRKVLLLEKKSAAFDQVKQAVNSGGLTAETLTKIERELKLL
jgi:hypothetical protein